jgi:hypothetical protein
MKWHRCKIMSVRVAADGTETAPPVTYVMLTEILNLALMAVSTNAIVSAAVEKPNANNAPFTQINRLEMFAVGSSPSMTVERRAGPPGNIWGLPQPPDLTVHNLTVTGDIFLTNQPQQNTPVFEP